MVFCATTVTVIGAETGEGVIELAGGRSRTRDPAREKRYVTVQTANHVAVLGHAKRAVAMPSARERHRWERSPDSRPDADTNQRVRDSRTALGSALKGRRWLTPRVGAVEYRSSGVLAYRCSGSVRLEAGSRYRSVAIARPVARRHSRRTGAPSRSQTSAVSAASPTCIQRYVERSPARTVFA